MSCVEVLMHATRCLATPFTICLAHEGASPAGCQSQPGAHLAMQHLLLGDGSLTALPIRGPVMHSATLCSCLPAEHMRGTPSRLSPMLAAWAATTLAAWTCSVRETASEGGPSLGPWPSADTACSTPAQCSLSSLSMSCLRLTLIT